MTDTTYRENAKPKEPEETIYISVLVHLADGKTVRITNPCFYSSFEEVRDSGIRQIQNLCSRDLCLVGNYVINVKQISHVRCEILRETTPGSSEGLILHEEFMAQWNKETAKKRV